MPHHNHVCSLSWVIEFKNLRMFTFTLQTPISQRKRLVSVAPANKMPPPKNFQFMNSSEFEFSPSEVSSIQYCVHIPY